MKIKVNRIPNFGEIHVTIDCDEQDISIQHIIDDLTNSTIGFQGKKNDRNYVFNENDVFYVESIDDQCFLYTKDEVYDCKYRLYEAEGKSNALIRVNKNIVLNYHKIKFFKSTLNGRLEATLINGDRVEISRTYVAAIKTLLGGGSK